MTMMVRLCLILIDLSSTMLYLGSAERAPGPLITCWGETYIAGAFSPFHFSSVALESVLITVPFHTCDHWRRFITISL